MVAPRQPTVVAEKAPHRGSTKHDPDNKLLHHGCECGREIAFPYEGFTYLCLDVNDRNTWALRIGACPACGGDIHLNCNLPDDHPHPSSKVVNDLIAHLGKPRAL